ncbi:MAG: DUF4258 domain-containing protein [Candidatus Thermoplasmatota archaeon]
MPNIRYSRHARIRMIERGISTAEVVGAIEQGSKRRQDGKIVAAHRHVEVVFKMVKGDCYVITVMLRW